MAAVLTGLPAALGQPYEVIVHERSSINALASAWLWNGLGLEELERRS